MAQLEVQSNLKCITSGNVPTTENLLDGEFAFGNVGGEPKLYGNVNGTIVDFSGDITIDADTLNGLLSGGNNIVIKKNATGDKVEVELSNNITLGPPAPVQGKTSSLTIMTFGGSKPVYISLDDNGISTLFITPNTLETISAINIVEDGIKYVDGSGASEVTYNYLREGNVKTVNGQNVYGSGDIQSYPVGSIYLSTSSTKPGSLFGGTWEQIKDVFLLSAGDTYSAGLTGGEATHTLTVEEMPAHAHDLRDLGINWSSGPFQYLAQFTNEGSPKGRAMTTYDTGGGKSHNNMPPYQVVYMWKRIA